MSPDFEKTVYEMIAEFVTAINESDTNILQSRYNVTKAILDEINEEIEIYFGRKVSLGIAPINEAFSDRGPRPYIEVYEMDESNCWGASVLFGQMESLKI